MTDDAAERKQRVRIGLLDHARAAKRAGSSAWEWVEFAESLDEWRELTEPEQRAIVNVTWSCE